MKVRFPICMLVLVSLAWAGQALILQQAWAENPFTRSLHGDAEVYWAWAGAIAEGQWVADTPFQSAPLYPYFLGLLRMAGFGLLGVLVVQAVLHGLTLLLVADATRRRAGPAAGVLAGVLWLLFVEAAFGPTKIWAVPLQLFTGALLLWSAAHIPDRYGLRALLGLGVAMALAVLANPALLPAVLGVAAWAAFAAPERNVFGACAALGVVVLALVPVTLHNRAASEEWILLTAHSGVTFVHGNAPGATGTYQPIPGVSEMRRTQNDDARRIARDEAGADTWKAVDDYWWERGLGWARSHPGDFLLLEARKLWWLLTGRHYADLYNPVLERRMEFGSRLRIAPLPFALILPLALAGLVLRLRRHGLRGTGAEAALLLLPALVVLIFWYSPRYRLPMAPAAFLLAADFLVAAVRAWRDERRMGLLVTTGVLVAASVAAGIFNRTSRFDTPAELMPAFLHSVGDALWTSEDRREEALPYLEESVQRGFDNFNSRYSLARALMSRAQRQLDESVQLSGKEAADRYAEAIETYEHVAEQLREAIAHDATRLEAQYNLASIEHWFWELGRRNAADARARLQVVLELAREQGNETIAAEVQGKLAAM